MQFQLLVRLWPSRMTGSPLLVVGDRFNIHGCVEQSNMQNLFDSLAVSRSFFESFGGPGLFAVAFLEFFLLPIPPLFDRPNWGSV